jgi:hypothetical protein
MMTMKTFLCSRDMMRDETKLVPTVVFWVVAAALVAVVSCVRPSVRVTSGEEWWLPLPRLEPGVILTTPEGAYLIDLLWLEAGGGDTETRR